MTMSKKTEKVQNPNEARPEKMELSPTPVVARPMVAGVLLAPAAISLFEKLLNQNGY
jgi:hypothetical protein